MSVPQAAATREFPSQRAILRVVVTVLLSAAGVWVLYLLREPIGQLILAAFVAVCAAGPVSALQRHMRKGFAIAIVYLGIVVIPIVILILLIAPLVTQIVNFVDRLPEYIADLNEAFEENERLRELNEDYQITEKLESLSDNAADALGSAAGALADVGAGLIGSIFSGVTILVLSMFMVARGPAWIDALLSFRPEREAEVTRRALEKMAQAVGGYVGGALLQATVAGVASWIMLVILGVPEPLALALLMAILDLIPLVGATIGAVIVGVVTLFATFPVDTIIWALFAIAYQQFENYVIQPRIQSRAASLDPFLVVVAAIFGGALLGIAGALLAIPTAAALRIAVIEFFQYRQELREAGTEAAAGAPT